MQSQPFGFYFSIDSYAQTEILHCGQSSNRLRVAINTHKTNNVRVKLLVDSVLRNWLMFIGIGECEIDLRGSNNNNNNTDNDENNHCFEQDLLVIVPVALSRKAFSDERSRGRTTRTNSI